MTSIAPGNQTVDPPRRSRALGVPRWLPRPTLIILRLPPLIPVLLVTVLLVPVLLAAALTGDDGAVATLKQNAAGLLGNAALPRLAVTFAITSVTTVTRLAMAPDPGAGPPPTCAALGEVPDPGSAHSRPRAQEAAVTTSRGVKGAQGGATSVTLPPARSRGRLCPSRLQGPGGRSP